MSENTVWSLQKSYLIGLASWLAEQSLYGKDSRERSRFVALLSAEITAMEKERIEILEKFADKDEDGKPMKAVDNGQEHYVIADEKKADLQAEYQGLLDENFVLDIGEGHKSKIKAVRDILLNTDYKFGPRETDSPMEAQGRIRQSNDYEKWCESFEVLDL